MLSYFYQYQANILRRLIVGVIANKLFSSVEFAIKDKLSLTDAQKSSSTLRNYHETIIVKQY